MHEVAAARFSSAARVSAFIACELQPKRQCHLCLSSSHLPQYICISFGSDVVVFLPSPPNPASPGSQNAARPLSNHTEMRGGGERGEYRDVKLHYGYYSAAGNRPPSLSPRCRRSPTPLTLQLRMRPWLLMSRRGGTSVETKGFALVGRETPTSTPAIHPPPPSP